MSILNINSDGNLSGNGKRHSASCFLLRHSHKRFFHNRQIIFRSSGAFNGAQIGPGFEGSVHFTY